MDVGKLEKANWGCKIVKIFISHKQEDSDTANRLASELRSLGIPYYLDILDSTVTTSGKALTEHIKSNLNDCTDIIVIMSEATRFSQWVPFEVGMSAQNDMPTATFLKSNVSLPEFLEYWPRLKYPSDIAKYVSTRREVQDEYVRYDMAQTTKSQTERFYDLVNKALAVSELGNVAKLIGVPVRELRPLPRRIQENICGAYTMEYDADSTNTDLIDHIREMIAP